ncbi:hypothetical protein TanjilG_00060 [Lupinus angustifolius]|uniref:Uncharacterized protein n=1 Tax=Lupinus angustifolius TaxID=3871 RepID=A0A394D004_LUPAN|nr:hypothetical protein TanjilG_00060 [Lupinus angustifolius]
MNRELTYALPFLILLLSSLFIYTFVAPFDRKSLSHLAFLSYIIPNNLQKSSLSCDYSNGRWVWDDTYPRQVYNESCRFLDPGFRCRKNGRKDEGYRKWRWQPDGCNLLRFNASDLLERNRNGRIVFAGDSVGRNQWESLLCLLSQGVSNLSTIYELNGNPISKHKGYLSMMFQEYNMTVEYYRVPFLSILGHPPLNSSTEVRMTIRLDELHWYSKNWEGADVIVFNSGHWWNQDKTIKANGTWNEGGNCDMETEPEKDLTKLEKEPYYNTFISDVVKQMQHGSWKVQFSNITYFSELRKDGHPSKYREPGTPPDAPQDCSHWCLPGVPDTWNELLYAQLLSAKFGTNSESGEQS